ncbi:MAG: hydrogenase maturation nickel metallochaperone HypA [Chloroflexi bacterium]|nr:hydrogenase maturation nickel metallochaperone HypA [Chloroflexota bacterium]
MHELAVTESILEIALRHSNEAGGGRITNLYLVIGQLASVVDDSVQFYWDILAKDTLAEGARLHFKRFPARMACLACKFEFSLNDSDFLCPSCSSQQIKLVSGEEFYLEAIDVE